jgi:hypothetical protein
MKMLNLKLIAIFSIILTVTIISCSKDDIEIVGKKGLIPLKSGNNWTYKIYRSNIEVGTITLTVGDYITINGSNGFKFSSGNYPFNETFIVDNDNDGNFVTIGGYSDNDTLISESIRYKKDAAKGDSWAYQELSYNEGGIFEKTDIEVLCISADTIINTPKGDFKCKAFKRSPNSGLDVFYDYISENIGIVKSTQFENNNLFSYQILLDYKVNN